MMRSSASSPLSARQSEIADFVVRGKTSRAIADELCLSPRTVETHLAAIFDKLGVSSRAELVPAGDTDSGLRAASTAVELGARSERFGNAGERAEHAR